VLFPKIKEYNDSPLKKQYPENVLHINTWAGRGGAAKCAYDHLCVSLRASANYDSNILVKESFVSGEDNGCSIIENYQTEEQLDLIMGEKELGWLDFCKLASFDIKNSNIFKDSDILHLHNLHGWYFSPFALPELTSLKPTVWTLHDEHSFTGHCAFTYQCEKWRSSCKNCPNLDTYPRLGVDSAEFLRKTKKIIYDYSSFVVVCPSLWLKNRAEKSILKNKDIRHIPNGVDINIFNLKNKLEMRKKLNLPLDKKILLFSSDFGTDNPYKGGEYIKQTYEILKNREDLFFLIIGGDSTELTDKNLKKVEYLYNEKDLSEYYSASDLFIYPTLADNFPYVVLESMACGTPVVAFNTGGVPEQIQHCKTGYLAKYKDTLDFINGINLFINNEQLLFSAGIEANKFIEAHFTLELSINRYINLYEEIYSILNK